MRTLFLILLLMGLPQIPSARTFEWQTDLPESQGMSTPLLARAGDSLAAHNTNAFLVIRHDRIVYEWYREGHGPGRKQGTASLAKALVCGTTLLWALSQDRIQLDEPACNYITEWKTDPHKSKINIRHLATHSSGLSDAKHPKYNETVPGWMEAFWDREQNPFQSARDDAPLLFRPGTKDAYSNPGIAMLGYGVTRAIRDSPYPDIRTLLEEAVFGKMGMDERDYSIGYQRSYTADDLSLVAGWGGGAFTPRASARVGRMMLKKGNWEGIQILDSAWVDQATTYAGTPLPDRALQPMEPARGIVWYSNFDGIWRGVPRDAFWGSGAQDQILIVIPSLDLIIVRNGGELIPGTNSSRKGQLNYVALPVIAAITDHPYPASEIISDVEWAPAGEVIRMARGSDNWPVTWGDDDHLYTAYGDGNGFKPYTEIKLSMGLARIEGNPPGLTPFNIRSPEVDRVGDGAAGPKASGLLMVEGVLYMLVRNARWDGSGSRLAWSEDHGLTWQWADWMFTESFGYPAFLNFGRNYEGARDTYVYIYSHDSPSAYSPSDDMVLARVPMDRIMERNEWEFFTGTGPDGSPTWHEDIRRRETVFSHPGQCYRSSVSYHPGLGRYLWCQTKLLSLDGLHARSRGGIGIFEAPEPWGPWRTVFYRAEGQWDMGAGDTSCLPVKWMSEDGKTAYLVFSGEDSFSVRRVVFHLDER